MDVQILGKRIKELRQKLNLTQREFTKELSITPATISAYEKNTVNPSIAVIAEISQKYNVSVDWLLGLSDKPTNNNSIETYADLIKLIIAILENPNIKTIIKKAEYGDYPNSYYRFQLCGILFETYNDSFEYFFDDLEKMNNLLENDSIDKEVYDLWIEKTLKKFDFSLEDGEIKYPNIKKQGD